MVEQHGIDPRRREDVLLEEKVWVNRTKDQIKDAPEYDDTMRGDAGYRSSLVGYYGAGGAGYSDWE